MRLPIIIQFSNINVIAMIKGNIYLYILVSICK